MIVSVGGWVLASLAVVSALTAWWLLAARMEAVARAAHELRGPLTAARLGLQLELRSERSSSRRLRAIELELASATLSLDDLSCSRTRRPKGRQGGGAEKHELELRALVEDCLEAWRAKAEVSGVQLRLEWGAGPSPVLGDRLRIAQATGNLIANAIEHGGGVVEVRGSAGSDAVRIEVIDGGPGLPAPVAQLARRAGRALGPRDHARRHSGRGRGLAIATAIAHAHGGRLAAAPTTRGARIVLELPLAGRAASTSRARP